MSSLINLSPFSNFEHLRRIFDDRYLTAATNAQTKAPSWVPAVDILEEDKAYEFHFDLPQHDKADLKVGVEDGVLTVHGERKFSRSADNSNSETKKRLLRVERSFGSFSRSFSLPEDVDSSKVEATYKDGVLTVRIAKDEKRSPKAVEVKIN
jgi:HSP20 family protein